MSFERTLLSNSRNDNQRVQDDENDADLIVPQLIEVKINEKRKKLRINALPLLTAVILILLFVGSYFLYTLIAERISNKKVEINTISKYSYPGCGKQKCKDLTCTSRHRRLVGGNEAYLNDWPWTADIEIDNMHTCGGILINRRYVLTAAHCLYVNNKPLDGKRLTVKLGSFNRILPELSRQVLNVCNYLIHELYNQHTMENDIAIIKLNDDVIFNDHVWPACLPVDDKNAYDDSKGYGFMLGWGKETVSGPFSPTLKEAYVPVIPYSKCSQQNDKIFREIFVNKLSNICVGYGSKSDEYACDGDSGGPFMRKIESSWITNGIISWVEPTCNSTKRNTYTILTRVAYYEKWLGSNMDLPFLEQ